MEKKTESLYTNQDYYDYILKINSFDSSYYPTYQNILRLLVKEGLERPISKGGWKVFFKIFHFHEKEWHDLTSLIHFVCAFERVVPKNDGSYELYPRLKDSSTLEDFLKYYCLGLKLCPKEIIHLLSPLVEKQKEKLKKAKLNPYYGDAKYLLLRTKAVMDAMEMLNQRDDIEEKDLVQKSLQNTQALLHSMLRIAGLENQEETFHLLKDFRYELLLSSSQYDLLKMNYRNVLEQEKKLLGISKKIWYSYALQNEGVFIHQLTSGAVLSDEMEKICTSFYSQQANVITDYFDANIGYAYPMDLDFVLTICETDVGSWTITQEEFIKRGLPETWQLDGTNIWYENPHHTPLFPPEYIEEQVLKRNSFAEILIDNHRKKIKPLYCFYTSKATPEQIQEIQDLARAQNLKVQSLEVTPSIYKTHL